MSGSKHDGRGLSNGKVDPTWQDPKVDLASRWSEPLFSHHMLECSRTRRTVQAGREMHSLFLCLRCKRWIRSDLFVAIDAECIHKLSFVTQSPLKRKQQQQHPQTTTTTSHHVQRITLELKLISSNHHQSQAQGPTGSGEQEEA